MRKKKLSYNIQAALLLEIVSIISGMVIPRMILRAYGSQVNGLVNSVAQFLSIITFMEFGVGSVVQSALYKPLAEKNDVEVSKVVCSAGKYFGAIGKVFLVYLVVLVIIYPTMINNSYVWSYSASLIFAMCINTCAEYFFGVCDKILLSANQQRFVVDTLQAMLIVVNAFVCYYLIFNGFSIQFVKLTTSLIFFLRVIIIRIFVNCHYNIDRRIKYDGEPIRQKWNGFAQHLSAVVLDGTDTIVLTMFSTLTNVSIYSAYYIVVKSIKQLVVAFNDGYKPLLGELWAKGDMIKLKSVFKQFEWIANAIVIFTFGCTGILIVPFVKVYTAGISDAEYRQPLFSVLIVTAYMLYCLSLPYLVMILAAGHYRQTQKYFIGEAMINLSCSILVVRSFGLVGVAIGTLIAMLFQLCWMVGYANKNYFNRKPVLIFKQFLTDAMIIAFAVAFTVRMQMSNVSYAAWICLAVKVVAVWAVVVLGVNALIYKNNFLECVDMIIKRDRLSG